jgi:hypothetical protein
LNQKPATNPPATQTPAATVPEAGGSAAPPATEPVIVKDVQHCQQVVELLERDQPIAIDLEGALWGKIDINLIQIAAKSGRCFLFDLVQPEAAKLFTEGGLGRLLEDVRVLKVGHDLRSDATALFKQFNIFMNHAFDTQGTVAYPIEQLLNWISYLEYDLQWVTHVWILVINRQV